MYVNVLAKIDCSPTICLWSYNLQLIFISWSLLMHGVWHLLSSCHLLFLVVSLL